jgi:hypothetical protein
LDQQLLVSFRRTGIRLCTFVEWLGVFGLSRLRLRFGILGLRFGILGHRLGILGHRLGFLWFLGSR